MARKEKNILELEKQPMIRTAYNPKENFSFDRVPSEFKSVTQRNINQIKNHCVRTIANKFKGEFKPNTLGAMVGVVLDGFDLLRLNLKSDRSTRKSKIKNAQSKGIQRVDMRIANFKGLTVEYGMALNRFADNVKKYDDSMLVEKMQFPEERMKQIERRLNKIKEKNHEA